MIMSGSPLAFWSLAGPDWRPGYNIHLDCKSPLCPYSMEAMLYEDLKEYLRTRHWKDFTKRQYKLRPYKVSDIHLSEVSFTLFLNVVYQQENVQWVM